MKSTWSRSLQMSLCAAAVCALGAVNAQTPPPAGAQPAPAEKLSPAPHQAHDGKHHHHSHKGTQHQGHHDKHAAPHKHEHEAGHGPADGHWKEHAGPHAGDIQPGEQLDQYQRNALARCKVFREADDRRACVERVRSAPVSGSVKEGGVLREFTEQVLVNP